ncbi:MAG TPA: cysteine methyltransferase, partial [Candidatus Limnocylindria bacterium]|nr:cysteine methyltransferase [Candidatus Limnocylindria bacterium]
MPSRDFAVASLDSPIGRLWLSGTDAGLRSIVRSDHPPDAAGALDPDALADGLRQLDEYFTGGRRGFDLPLDLGGVAAFHVAVYRAAMAIPYGET